jgi:hypothetical protein
MPARRWEIDTSHWTSLPEGGRFVGAAPRTESIEEDFMARFVLVLACALCAPLTSRAEEPTQVEVKSESAVMTYLGGEREQVKVERGLRLDVVRRMDAYYVVKVGSREALVAINDVIPAPTAAASEASRYVVTTAKAPLVVRVGRQRLPEVAEAGRVFEVLGKPLVGSTWFVLADGGRTAEVATKLVRPARPEEQPPAPKVGRVRGPVPLGCAISIDEQRFVRVDFAFPGSLGERLGLQPEMRILRVNGVEIHSAADYDQASSRLGGNLRLLIQRPGMDYPELILFEDPRNTR